MIYKFIAIIAIVGLASGNLMPTEKPSDLITQKGKPGILALSGTDFNKVFSDPIMKLQPLGSSHFMATDLSFLEWQKGAQDYLNQTPPLTPSI